MELLNELATREWEDIALHILSMLTWDDRCAVRLVNRACADMVRRGVYHIDLTKSDLIECCDDDTFFRPSLSSRFPNVTRLTCGSARADDVALTTCMLDAISMYDRPFYENIKHIHLTGFLVDVRDNHSKKEAAVLAVKTVLKACANINALHLSIDGLPAMRLVSAGDRSRSLMHVSSLADTLGNVMICGASVEATYDALMSCDTFAKEPQLQDLRLSSDMCPRSFARPSISSSLTSLSITGAPGPDALFDFRVENLAAMGPKCVALMHSVTVLTNLRTLVFHAATCHTTRRVMHVPLCWSTLTSLNTLDLAADEVRGDDLIVNSLTQLRYLRVLNGNTGVGTSIDNLTLLTGLTISALNTFGTMDAWPKIMASRRLKSVKIVNVQGIPCSGFPSSVEDLSVMFPSHYQGKTSAKLLCALSWLPDLKSLQLHRITLPTIFLTKVLEACSKLENLELDYVDFAATVFIAVRPTVMPNLKLLCYNSSNSSHNSKRCGMENTNKLIFHLIMPKLQQILIHNPISMNTFDLLRSGRIPIDCEYVIPLHIKVNNDQFITASVTNVNMMMREWIGPDGDHVLDLNDVRHEAVFTSVCLVGHHMSVLDLMPPTYAESFHALLPRLTDKTLSVIAAACPRLRKLRIASSEAFTPQGFSAITNDTLTSCKLVELEMWSCRDLDDSLIVSLVNRHPTLETLLLTGMERVGPVGYVRIREGLNSLKRIGLLGADRLDAHLMENHMFRGEWVDSFVLYRGNDAFVECVERNVSRIPRGGRVRWVDARHDVLCDAFTCLQ